jgi:Fe-S-cluster-containing dehydrogenase component
MSITRRELLKTSTRLLVLTPAAAAFLEQGSSGATTAMDSKYQMAEHYWAMSIDVEKCIGCGNCVRACAAENGVPKGYFRTWIERYQVGAWPDDHPDVDSPNGGYDGFPEKKHEGAKSFFVPKLCNQCAHSPCVQVCPVGATFESPDGLVLVDKTYCRYIDPAQQVVDKCTFCYHRISQGLTTACAETCPTGARTLGDLKNPKDPIHEFLRTNSVQVLKPHMATGAKLYYRALDESVR